MKFLVITVVALSIAVSASAKAEKKKLDLTTITKPVTKAEPETTTAPAADVRDGYTPIDLKQLKDVNKPIKMNSKNHAPLIATVIRTENSNRRRDSLSNFRSAKATRNYFA